MGDASTPFLRQPAASLLPSPNPTASIWQTTHQTPVKHHRSTEEIPRQSTVIIIGTGLTAVFAARELLCTFPSLDLLVLEARGTCSAATGRNGGHLKPQTFGKEYDIVDFELENYDYIANIIEQNEIPCEFRRLTGCHGFWNKTYFEENKAILNQFQRDRPALASYTRAVENTQDLEAMRLKGAVGAIVSEKAGSLSPYKLVTWLWEDMLRHYPNLNLQTETAVTALGQMPGDTHDEEWQLTTSRGVTRAKFVLVATNGYTAHLLPQFRDLITPVACWMAALKPPVPGPFLEGLIPNSYGMSGVGPQDRVQDDFLVQRPIVEKVSSGLGASKHPPIQVPSAQLMFGGARAQVDGNGVGVSDDSTVPDRAGLYLKSVLPKLLDLTSSRETDSGVTDQLESDGEWAGIWGYSRDYKPWVGDVPNMHNLYLSAGYTGHGQSPNHLF